MEWMSSPCSSFSPFYSTMTILSIQMSVLSSILHLCSCFASPHNTRIYPPKRINYWKANQYAYASFHGSLPDDEITQCNDICGSVIPYTIVLTPSAQGVWSAVMESTIRFSPSDSLWRTKRWKPWWMRSKSSLRWPNTSHGSDPLLLVQMQMVNEKQVIHA